CCRILIGVECAAWKADLPWMVRQIVAAHRQRKRRAVPAGIKKDESRRSPRRRRQIVGPPALAGRRRRELELCGRPRQRKRQPQTKMGFEVAKILHASEIES